MSRSGERAEEAGFATDVDGIVAQLRRDPVLVEEVMGNGHTAEVADTLRDLAADARVPVYVVLTRTPVGLGGSDVDEELTSLIHAGVGEDGIYYVHTTEGIGEVGAWGDPVPGESQDAILVGLVASRGRDQVAEEVEDRYGDDHYVSAATEAAMALEALAEPTLPDYSSWQLTDEQLDTYASETWVGYNPPYREVETPEPPGSGLSAIVAVTTGLVVTAFAYRLLRARAAYAAARAGGRDRHDSPPSTDEAVLERVRAQATSALTRLEQQLSGSPGADRERLDVAVGSRDAGLDLVGSDDLLDVVGALVLARSGLHALTRQGTTPYRPCYADPLHGRATETAPVGPGAAVPVCRRCAGDLAGGTPPEALPEPRRLGRPQPYYTGDTVWARTGYGALVDDLWLHVERSRR